MKIFADYHTHTVHSHGKGTIRDNVEAARKRGLREICITDHGPGHKFYGVKSDELGEMRAEVDSLQKEYSDIKILLGVEANLISLDGDIDVMEEDFHYLDMLLVGFHNGAFPRSMNDCCKLYLRNYTAKIIPNLREKCRQDNTDAMILAMEKYKIDIITHPGAKIDMDIKRLAKAAASSGTALEINSSHGFLDTDSARTANEQGAKFVLSSDAHTPENVGNVDNAIKVAIDAEIPVSNIINAEE